MKIAIIIRNTITAETFTFDRAEIVKACIAVDYLTTITSFLWFLEIVVE